VFLAAVVIVVAEPITIWSWAVIEIAALFWVISLSFFPNWRKIVRDNFIKEPILAVFAVAMVTSFIAYAEKTEGIDHQVFLIVAMIMTLYFVICSFMFIWKRRHALKKEVVQSGTLFIVCALITAYSGKLVNIVDKDSFVYWLSWGILFAAVVGMANVLNPIIEEAINKPGKDDQEIF
jgi:Ca2+/Na+ antiporter